MWTTLYSVLDKKLLKTTDLTKNNTHEISFQISNLQCMKKGQENGTSNLA